MSGAIALAAGTLLAVGALGFVLYPLFFETRERRPSPRRAPPAEDSAIRALREIEFDRATGKLSDADYAELRRTYGAKAVQELRAGASEAPTESPAAPVAPVAVDDVEVLVRAYRDARPECRTCGLRPEADAIYCSTCGAFLDEKCPACGANVVESSAGFCSSCGAGLGAAV